eukprot:g44089.t1
MNVLTVETKFPKALFIVAGDFNQANFKRALPKYHQHISCPTRGPNILGHCYTINKDAYRSIPCPHFRKSDHSAEFVLPAYKQMLKWENASQKETVLVQGCGRPSPGLLGIDELDCVQEAHAVCLNDYHPVALTSIIVKCFERLVMDCINSSLPTCLSPLQFAYQRNRSTADAISLDLHSSLEHLDNKGTYIRLLLINYSSTFNTIIPFRLISKLRDLGLGSALCSWILSDPPATVSEDSSTKELIIDFRKKGGEHPPIYINGTEVERVESIKFLRAAQEIWRTLTNSYRYTIESFLSRCITAWFGNFSAQDRKKLQKVVCTAQTITKANCPSMDSIYTARCHGKAANIIKDPSHP